MRGQRLVQFPFEFEYSEGGQFKTEFGVTLTAPGLAQIKVHSQMTAWAKRAELGLATQMSGMKRPTGEAAEAVVDEAPETDEEMADRVTTVFAMGLGEEKYPEFLDYVKRVLTNNPALARVGETQVPITDGVWMSLDQNGGMSAVLMLVAGFASFFLANGQRNSGKTNGNSLQPGSHSAAAVH